MKIHVKDPSLSSPTSPQSSGKRKRPSAVLSKKKHSQSDDREQADEPANKRVRFVACFCNALIELIIGSLGLIDSTVITIFIRI